MNSGCSSEIYKRSYSVTFPIKSHLDKTISASLKRSPGIFEMLVTMDVVVDLIGCSGSILFNQNIFRLAELYLNIQDSLAQGSSHRAGT